MSKVASYLQEHLRGEVFSGEQARQYFSRDASVLTVRPEMVAYPFNVSDVRKIARFTWQLAEKGHNLALTPRGGGTDSTGAAIGKGAILSFPAHMNKILEVDTKQRLARVQPGVSLKTFQEAMQTHGLCLPFAVDPSAVETMGGAVANNIAGRRSIKYGSMKYWVDSLEVVLANGEVIQTGKVSKRELSKKQGQPTLEGEIYRQIDGLINENQQAINESVESPVSSNLGYNLADVKQKDGSFDLTPLIVGSQGTLGVVTEMIVKLAPYIPQTELLVVSAKTAADARDILELLLTVEPSSVEMLDNAAISFAAKYQNVQFNDLLDDNVIPEVMFFAEFDGGTERARRRRAKQTEKTLLKAGHAVLHSGDYDEQQRVWQICNSAVSALTLSEKDGHVPLPIIDDATIPTAQLEKYLQAVGALARKYHTTWPVWGQAGEGRFRIMPSLDLRRVSDRQKVLKIVDEYAVVVSHLGGSIASASGEGRLGAPFASRELGKDLTDAYKEVKNSFDPNNTLNPGVKVNTELKDLVSAVSDSYSKGKMLDYLLPL